MKKLDKILNTIIWLIAFISVLANIYLNKELIRLQEENKQLKEKVVGGTNL